MLQQDPWHSTLQIYFWYSIVIIFFSYMITLKIFEMPRSVVKNKVSKTFIQEHNSADQVRYRHVACTKPSQKSGLKSRLLTKTTFTRSSPLSLDVGWKVDYHVCHHFQASYYTVV